MTDPKEVASAQDVAEIGSYVLDYLTTDSWRGLYQGDWVTYEGLLATLERQTGFSIDSVSQVLSGMATASMVNIELVGEETNQVQSVWLTDGGQKASEALSKHQSAAVLHHVAELVLNPEVSDEATVA